ncbi:c-type cytochrome [Azospirillum sp.]|uniref:c-type cytochrome n=1 Tax=Azospirillum sp. TaxID=34012 RepID=UPI003D71D897
MNKLSVALAAAVLFALPSVASANPAAGKAVYAANCEACHGPDGTAVLPGAPNFSKGERLEKADKVLATTVQNGLNAMPAWKGMLNDQEIANALAYIRTLKR